MGSKFYGKKKATAETELDALISSALDTPEVEAALDEAVEEVVAEATEVKEETKSTAHRAYNTYFDTELEKFVLITIEYDPATLTSKVVSKESVADNYAVALYKLNQIITLKLVRGDEKT